MATPRTSRGACTLPQAYYTSPEIHDLESEKLFDRAWLCVGLTASIPSPGAYFLVSLEGESLIVVRGRDGAVRAFHNVCRHRGTRLCTDASGTFSKYVVCPYHSWAYDLSGACVAAPHMDEVDGFRRDDHPLHAVATVAWEGLVFVNFASDPPAFETALAPLVGKFTRWDLPGLLPVHRTEYAVEANWKLLFQNYSECYHCPTLHPALNRLTPYRDSANDLEEGSVLGGPMQLSDGSDSMTIDGRACGTPLGDLAGDELRLVHYYVVLPSMFLSLAPDYALVHRLARRGPTTTSIVCDWLFRRDAIDTPGFDPSGAIEFWDMTNRQDWQVCERSQAGISSRAYRPGPYAELESMLAALDREYLRMLGRTEP